MLAWPQVRSTTKIESRNSLYPHRYFTEHLVGAFRKPPRERNSNHETLSLSIRWLKNYTGFSLQRFTHNRADSKWKSKSAMVVVKQQTCSWTLWAAWAGMGHQATEKRISQQADSTGGKTIDQNCRMPWFVRIHSAAAAKHFGENTTVGRQMRQRSRYWWSGPRPGGLEGGRNLSRND
jgi:hypothetical protein